MLMQIYTTRGSVSEDAKHEYNLELVNKAEKGKYDAIIIAVSHQQFKEMGAEGLHALGKENHVLYDIKYILSSDDVDGRLQLL